MNGNRYGWFGLLSLLGVLIFLAFPNFIHRVLPNKVASTTLMLAMFSSILLPILASMRASRWWLLVALCGILSVFRFLWRIVI